MTGLIEEPIPVLPIDRLSVTSQLLPQLLPLVHTVRIALKIASGAFLIT